MKNKKIVRLTESQLHNIIFDSVKKILRESRNSSSTIDIVSANINNIMEDFEKTVYNNLEIDAYDHYEDSIDYEYEIPIDEEHNIIIHCTVDGYCECDDDYVKVDIILSDFYVFNELTEDEYDEEEFSDLYANLEKTADECAYGIKESIVDASSQQDTENWLNSNWGRF